MKSVKMIESYRLVKNEIGKRFHPVEKYFWIIVLSLSTSFTSWLYQTDPSFRFLVFSPVRSSIEWLGYFVFADFVFASLFAILLGAVFGGGVLVGMLIITARKNDWKHVILTRLKRITERNDHIKMTDEQEKRIIGTIEHSLAEMDIPTRKKFEHSLTQAHTEIEKLKKMIPVANILRILHCSNCGNEIQVDMPEKGYFPSKKSCEICFWNNVEQPIIYNCAVCENQDIRYWHNPQKHSLFQRLIAHLHKITKK